METAPDALDALIEIGSGILQYASDAQGPTVVINVCCGGTLHTAEKALRPLRAFGPPATDTIRPMSYLEAQALGDFTPLLNHATPRYSGYGQFGFLTRLTDDAIDRIITHCEKPHRPLGP